MQDQTDSRELTLGRLSRAVRAHPALIVLAVLLGALAGAGYALASPPLYESRITLAVEPTAGPLADARGQGLSDGQALRRRNTLVAELASSATRAELAEHLRMAGRSTEYEQLVVVPIQDTDLADVVVSAQDPRQAELVAAGVGHVFSARVERAFAREAQSLRAQLESRLALIDDRLARLPQRSTSITDSAQASGLITQRQDVEAQLDQLRVTLGRSSPVVVPASLPDEPAGLQVVPASVLGLLFGLLLGVALCVVLDRSSSRLRTLPDLARAVPGARTVLDVDLAGRGRRVGPEDLAQRLVALGLGSREQVVGVLDATGYGAAHLAAFVDALRARGIDVQARRPEAQQTGGGTARADGELVLVDVSTQNLTPRGVAALDRCSALILVVSSRIGADELSELLSLHVRERPLLAVLRLHGATSQPSGDSEPLPLREMTSPVR